MAAKTPRNPFRGFLDVMTEMNRMQHQWMQRADSEPEAARTTATAWVPAADIYTISGDLIIRCDLAGLRREDVDVTVSGGVLTISGSRYNDLDGKKVTYYASERFYGLFRRSMILPDNVEKKDVSANFDNGLLEITVKGGANAKMHSIDIGSQGAQE